MCAIPTKKTIDYRKKKKLKLNLLCWLFMLPTIISYILFQGWPIIASIYYSSLDWSGLSKGSKFIGLNNYKELLNDSLFWNSFSNSFKYTLMAVPLFMIISLAFAYILNIESLKGRTIFRTLYFIPVITTASIIGIIMIFIWGANGPANGMLQALHIIDKPVNWLGNPKLSMFTVIMISIWKDVGTYMIYWLAALSSVPKDVYEAAEVDGAGKVRVLFSIVLPMIMPIAGTILILCSINSLKVFDIIKTMTNGGPFYATDVIATFVYRLAFSSEIGMPRLGYASAASLLFGAVVILMTATLQRAIKIIKDEKGQSKKEGYKK